MERGANTFPFHNLLPYSESNEGLFLFFSPSLNWIKEKSVATLSIRTFAIQKSQSQFTVLHSHTCVCILFSACLVFTFLKVHLLQMCMNTHSDFCVGMHILFVCIVWIVISYRLLD